MHLLTATADRTLGWLANPAEWFERLTWQELLLLLATMVVLLVLAFLYMPALESGLDRRGILALELAWSPARAQEIVDGWRTDKLLGQARKGAYVDFAFIVFYALAGVLLVLLLARAAADSDAVSAATAADLASYGARAIVLAGALDAVENVFLLRLLRAERVGRLAVVVSALATAKFLAATVTVGVVVILAAALLAAATPWS